MRQYILTLYLSAWHHRTSIRSSCYCSCPSSLCSSNTTLYQTGSTPCPVELTFSRGLLNKCLLGAVVTSWLAIWSVSGQQSLRDCQKASCKVFVCLWSLPYYAFHYGYSRIFWLIKLWVPCFYDLLPGTWHIVGILREWWNFRKPLSERSVFQYEAAAVRAVK